jgi:hypothetical protein
VAAARTSESVTDTLMLSHDATRFEIVARQLRFLPANRFVQRSQGDTLRIASQIGRAV